MGRVFDALFHETNYEGDRDEDPVYCWHHKEMRDHEGNCPACLRAYNPADEPEWTEER